MTTMPSASALRMFTLAVLLVASGCSNPSKPGPQSVAGMSPSSDTAHVIDVWRYGQIQPTSWDNALDLGRPGHCLIIADQGRWAHASEHGCGDFGRQNSGLVELAKSIEYCRRCFYT